MSIVKKEISRNIAVNSWTLCGRKVNNLSFSRWSVCSVVANQSLTKLIKLKVNHFRVGETRWDKHSLHPCLEKSSMRCCSAMARDVTRTCSPYCSLDITTQTWRSEEGSSRKLRCWNVKSIVGAISISTKAKAKSCVWCLTSESDGTRCCRWLGVTCKSKFTWKRSWKNTRKVKGSPQSMTKFSKNLSMFFSQWTTLSSY